MTWGARIDGKNALLEHDPPAASTANPKSQPEAKDDFQSLPLAAVEKKLASSPDGLTQAEAEKRLTQYGPQ